MIECATAAEKDRKSTGIWLKMKAWCSSGRISGAIEPCVCGYSE